MHIQTIRTRRRYWPKHLGLAAYLILIVVLTLLFLIGFRIGHAQALPGVSLVWDYTQSTDPNAQADSFVVERCAGSGCTNFTALPIPPIPVATKTYLDTAVTAGTTYRWQVKAKGPGGISAPSNALAFQVPLPAVPPVAPTGLRGSWQP